MSSKELITETAWNEFIKLSIKRIKKMHDKQTMYYLSEETFRLDYAFSISNAKIDPSNVYCEYPCDNSFSQKLDIFVDVDDGYCIEIKFLRPIPSKKNPPFTQHYGAILADMLKLTLLCDKERSRFLVIVMDDNFHNYFVNKGLLSRGATEEHIHKIMPNFLPITAVKEIQKRLKNISIPKPLSIKIHTLKIYKMKHYFLYLLEIKPLTQIDVF